MRKAAFRDTLLSIGLGPEVFKPKIKGKVYTNDSLDNADLSNESFVNHLIYGIWFKKLRVTNAAINLGIKPATFRSWLSRKYSPTKKIDRKEILRKLIEL